MPHSVVARLLPLRPPIRLSFCRPLPISFAPGPLRPFFHRFRNAVARRQPSFTEYSSVSDAGAYTIAYSIPIFDANGTVAQVAASSILASSVEGAVSWRDDPALSRACLSHC